MQYTESLTADAAGKGTYMHCIKSNTRPVLLYGLTKVDSNMHVTLIILSFHVFISQTTHYFSLVYINY